MNRKQVINNSFSIVFKLLSTYTMFYFALPKLRGLPVSVTSFTQFGEVLGISGTGFMYFTGSLELVTAFLLLISIFLKRRTGDYATVVGYLLLLGIMIGGLLTEYFVRVTPVPMLVGIAILFVLIAVSQIWFKFKTICQHN